MGKEFTAAEVAKHKSVKDCWVIINGLVLDLTEFIQEHPGGKEAIMIFAGTDASEDFNLMHSNDYIEKVLILFFIFYNSFSQF